jgi:alpha-beta hydrolase superfamily lysophospholipase
MQHAEGTFRGCGDIQLIYQSWCPEGRPRAVLAITHGFGEHCGRYGNVVNALVPRGYAVYGFDLRGHGGSPGSRGHVSRWSEHREDTRAFVGMVAREEAGLPLFLMGHSLGGLIVLEYVLHEPDGLAGVIASGPLLGDTGVSPVLFALSRILSRVWPSFSMDTKLDATMISRDPAVVQAYRGDPLVHSIGSARMGTEMMTARLWTQTHAADLRLPFLMVQGSADRLTLPEAGRTFFERVSSSDKEYRLYADAYHEVHNDLCHEQELADIAAWLDRRV